MNENKSTLSDAVKIELIRGIKEILIKLIDKAFSTPNIDEDKLD